MLSIGFSFTANAKNIDVPEYTIKSWAVINGVNNTSYTKTFTPFDDDIGYSSFHPEGVNIYENHTKFYTSGDFLISKGKSTTIYINDFQSRIYRSVENKYYNIPNSLRVLFTFDDNTEQYFDKATITANEPYFNIQMVIPSLTKNIKSIEVISTFTFNWNENSSIYLGELADSKFFIVVDQKSEEVGLLESISNWLSGIFDSIVELPLKIWEFIENGLKALFVPDSEYIASYKDKWDTLLSDRLGVVYQSGQLLVDLGNRIIGLLYSDTEEYITLPLVSLESVGIPFEFGGYEVKVIPDGFDSIVMVTKVLSVIIGLLLFLNGMRKRYDKVMEG